MECVIVYNVIKEKLFLPLLIFLLVVSLGFVNKAEAAVVDELTPVDEEIILFSSYNGYREVARTLPKSHYSYVPLTIFSYDYDPKNIYGM